MKYLFIFFLGLPLISNSQECKLIKANDPFTKEKTISTGFIALEGASLTIDANKQEIDMLFTISGADKCFSDGNMASIFFAGTKFKLSQRNNGSMNCEGIVHFVLRNSTTTPSLLKRFATQKIDKIVFIGNNKKESVVTFTPEQQQLVLDLAACMSNEAPTLLQ
jgi:hypothetical protein